MLLSTKRHVGLDLQAELDDARAEIRDLRAENAALKRDMHAQRAHYEKEIAYLKGVGQHLLDLLIAIEKPYPEDEDEVPTLPPPPPPPSSLTQQAAQMNPDEKIVIMNSYLVTAVKRPGLQHTP